MTAEQECVEVATEVLAKLGDLELDPVGFSRVRVCSMYVIEGKPPRVLCPEIVWKLKEGNAAAKALAVSLEGAMAGLPPAEDDAEEGEATDEDV